MSLLTSIRTAYKSTLTASNTKRHKGYPMDVCTFCGDNNVLVWQRVNLKTAEVTHDTGERDVECVSCAMYTTLVDKAEFDRRASDD